MFLPTKKNVKYKEKKKGFGLKEGKAGERDSLVWKNSGHVSLMTLSISPGTHRKTGKGSQHKFMGGTDRRTI